MDIWQWTLTNEATAPCFVRDVLDMRNSGLSLPDVDFFWLGYTPCRTVLLVGMVVAIQVYDKRTIYTIDDGTAVIDCVLRHPPPRSTAGPSAMPPQHNSPKKQRLESIEPPSPVTEPGYPVRVVGRVVRHYQSKQIHANSIDPCPSSLDEIAHLEHVIQLHKTTYSLAIPFVPPPKPTSRAPPPDASTPHANASVFANTSLPGPSAASYTLPAPPHMPMPLQNRNRPPPLSTRIHATYHAHTNVPSSPTTSSVVSSTPSSPCKPSSPLKQHEAPSKPKLRHPSRLHTRDLTANTFRLYVKHYMDNAPPPFSVPSWSSPPRNMCMNVTTPTKCARFGQGDHESNEATPRPRPRPNAREIEPNENGDEEGLILGFTLSHLRRVPELALLAARVVRAETRKRDKAERDETRDSQRTRTRTSSTSSRPSRRGSATDPPRKKMKRLFSWAVVKLYEEGSIVLWEGDVRPLPVPPPPPGEDMSGNTLEAVSVDPSMSTCGSTSVLYDLSASASLYSHYHAPRRQGGEGSVSVLDDDADTADLSDPSVDEEAYVPLNPQFLTGYVEEAVGVLRRGRQGAVGHAARGTALTAEEVLACMQRMDGRWTRVGVWAVEGALAALRAG